MTIHDEHGNPIDRRTPGGLVPLEAMHDPYGGMNQAAQGEASPGAFFQAVDTGPPSPDWPRKRSVAPHDIRCSRCGAHYPGGCKCDDWFPTKEMSAQYHGEWLCRPCRVNVANGAPRIV